MIILHGKTEFEPIKLNNDKFYEYVKVRHSKNIKKIFFIFLIIIIFIIFCFSIAIINNITKNLKSQIQQKDLKIENLEKDLNDSKELIKELQEKNSKEEKKDFDTLMPLDREYLFDKEFYKKHNTESESTLNKLGYKVIVYSHVLEKGMQHFYLRPFSLKNTEILMKLIEYQTKYKGHEHNFSFINGINSLREYKKSYETNGWIDREEYKKVNDFLKNFKKIEDKNAGAFILTKKELEQDYKINYLKFIKSRHSTRNYKNETIKLDDVKAAVEMAKYSASACNRQYVRIHFYPFGKKRDNVINYSIGKGGLYLEGVNTFIVTFDVNGLSGEGERNQGYFNAGLFSTNLVNAFHSLGIGTCFIQFANSVKEEEELKKKNDIPENERIAVIIFAGYYDEKSIFAVSPRKNVSELLIEHK